MNNKHIIFGLFTGLIVGLLGLLVISVSQVGWNLLFVSAALLMASGLAKFIQQKESAPSVGNHNSELSIGN